MYNYGIISFLKAKNIEGFGVIKSFLNKQSIKHFTYRNHNLVNDYLQDNWSRFCSYVDKELKSGRLKGNAIKLNTFFDEQRERNTLITREFKDANLNDDELKIINLGHDFNKVHSFLNKKGYGAIPKDRNYASKKLMNMPYILLLRQLGLVDELIKELETE